MKIKMENMLKRIGQKEDKERFDAITSILKEIEIPYTTMCNQNGVSNIVVTMQNDSKEESKYPLYFLAHYDVYPGSHGHNDNGSSIVILLCVAEYLKTLKSLPYDTTIVFTDKEEFGAQGAHFLCQQGIPKNSTIVNYDSCGYGDCIVGDKRGSSPILKKYEDIVDYFTILPASDSSAFIWHPVLTICAAPPLPDFYKIMHSMHNGKNDDIQYINYNIMQKIYEKTIAIFTT